MDRAYTLRPPRAAGVSRMFCWCVSAPAVWLAADAIVVPVEMRAITGIAATHRRRPGRARFRAVGERAASVTGSGRRTPAFGPERTARWRGRSTVAVVLAGLPVGVATIPVESATVRGGLEWQCQCEQPWKCRSHPAPCVRSRFNRFLDSVPCFCRAHKPEASCAVMRQRSAVLRRRRMTLRLCTLQRLYALRLYMSYDLHLPPRRTRSISISMALLRLSCR